jgi:hypothetical protein
LGISLIPSDIVRWFGNKESHNKEINVADISKETWDEIASDLRKTRSPSRTAKNLGYSIAIILQVVEDENQPRVLRQERHGGLGRPELQKHTVARKKVWQSWNNDLPEVAKARNDYEAGTHQMVTGYDGDWAILYMIPLRWPAAKPHYFLPEDM